MCFRETRRVAPLVALGRRIAELRVSRDLTQEELAHRLGITTRAYQRIEAGASTTTERLVQIARFLSVPLGSLFVETPRGPSHERRSR